MEPKRGAKNTVHCIFTHDKLSLFRVLKVPPDLPYGSVMAVR